MNAPGQLNTYDTSVVGYGNGDVPWNVNNYNPIPMSTTQNRKVYSTVPTTAIPDINQLGMPVFSPGLLLNSVPSDTQMSPGDPRPASTTADARNKSFLQRGPGFAGAPR